MKDGDVDTVKGRIEKAAGDLTDDDELRRQGRTDETAGRAKNAVSKAGESVRDAIDHVKDAVHRDR